MRKHSRKLIVSYIYSGTLHGCCMSLSKFNGLRLDKHLHWPFQPWSKSIKEKTNEFYLVLIKVTFLLLLFAVLVMTSCAREQYSSYQLSEFKLGSQNRNLLMQEAKIFLSFFRVCTFSQQKFFISDLELLGNLEQFSLFLSQSPTV